MTGATIAQLIVLLGPGALGLIEKLVDVWSRELTPEEVKAICATARKGYDEYIAEAAAKLPK